MCRLAKMTMSSRLSKFANLIHWELANGEGDPPVLTQWRSESESRKCKILLGRLGVGGFGRWCCGVRARSARTLLSNRILIISLL